MTNPSPCQFWWSRLYAPLAVFVVLAGIFATSTLDPTIARALFFDSTHGQWIAAHSWVVNTLIHNGGRWFVHVVAAVALCVWIATFFRKDLRYLRRPAGFVFIAMALSVGVVGLLKELTNVDCPWDLQPFGGSFPFVELFADRPDALRPGRCFPAAHSSSGYALIALYFALRERQPGLAKLALGFAIAVGLVFGFAQQARGAHFVSHDVWSAFLVWTITLSIYAFAFQTRLWGSARPDESESREEEQVAGDGVLAARERARMPTGAGAD